MVARGPKGWVPERQDIIWIDCNPRAGREMRDRHPFLELSARSFNDRTSLVLGLPMTTADYNADNPFAGGARTGKTSYILCHQPTSFDWRKREAAPHPMKQLADGPFAEALAVLNQIVRIA
ncbi:MAG: type II toxin-antitoxin system PemK/MazF family toxin [Rhodocyclales bacterium]|nr:type II toxin-antitoxin system PemK/MazF family toxin [Rhodocyclales bacterium]